MRKVLFILGQLTDADVEWLAHIGTRRRVAAGTEIIHFGTSIDTMYIVLDGTLRIVTDRGILLDQAASGDILGEISLVDSSPTSASVIVDQDATVLAIPKQLLVEKLKLDIGFAARFYRALALFLADRLRNSIRRTTDGKLDPNRLADTSAGELDADVLDNLQLAGARFERMLRMLAG